MTDYIQLHRADNVVVALRNLKGGEAIVIGSETVILKSDVLFGHKVAIRPVDAGNKIYKYGLPIGCAKNAITVGEHVHIHNLKSDYEP